MLCWVIEFPSANYGRSEINYTSELMLSYIIVITLALALITNGAIGYKN